MSLTPEQKAIRQQIVTATDLVKLTGTYPGRKGPCDVYLEKMADVELDDDDQYDAVDDDEMLSTDADDAIALGHWFEPRGLAALAQKRGFAVTPGVTEVSRLHAFLGATPDGNAMLGDRRIAVCEAKMVGPHRRSHWGDAIDQIPDYVLVQVTAQMIVCEVTVAHVVMGYGTAQKRFYEVEKDQGLADALVEVADTFHRKHLAPRIMPSSDGSAGARAMLQAAWPRHDEAMVAADEEAEDLAAEFIAHRKAEAEAKQRKDWVQQRLCEKIGTSVGLEGSAWKATWRKREAVVVREFVREPYRHFDLRVRKGK